MTMAGGSGIHRPDRVVKREYGARCIAEGLADGERPCCRPGHDNVGGGVSRFAYVAEHHLQLALAFATHQIIQTTGATIRHLTGEGRAMYVTTA